MPFETVADNIDLKCTYIEKCCKILEDSVLKLGPLCWTWQIECQSYMTFVKSRAYTQYLAY